MFGDPKTIYFFRPLSVPHASRFDFRMEGPNMRRAGKSLRLNSRRFHSCVEKGTYAAIIREDVAAVNTAGIIGTPTVVIGRTVGDT